MAQEIDDPALAAPPLRRAVDALGGARGTLLASLPTVGFVLGNALGGLVAGAVGGALTGLLVLVERLRGGHGHLPALGGFLALVALVALTVRSGSPSTFFLPAVLTLLAQSAGLLGAAAARRPVTGQVSALLAAVPATWRQERRLLGLFVQQDLVWAVLLALRSAVTAAFVLQGSITGAGLFRLTGTPMYVALVALCVRWARPLVSTGASAQRTCSGARTPMSDDTAAAGPPPRGRMGGPPPHAREALVTETSDLVATTYGGLADLLEQAPEDAWDAPSLCAGWRVRHVVAHVSMPLLLTPEQFGAELAAAGGDFGVLSDTVAGREAARSREDALAGLRSPRLHAWQPPGGGEAGALSHAVIHSLDVTLALGREPVAPTAARTAVLEQLLDAGGAHFGVDLSDVALVADDVDLQRGSGTQVRGDTSELVALLSGRTLPDGRSLPRG